MPLHHEVFDNGLHYIHEKTKKTNVTAINVFCNVGSIHETAEERGFSHLLEHMLFKGTKKNPKYIDIYRLFDEAGADLNASTYKNYTVYTVKCATQSASDCISMFSDMLFHSIIPNSEYVKEHHVVVEELAMDNDDKFDIMLDKKDNLIYKGTPYEHSIDDLTYHKHLPSRDKLLKFYRKYYTPQNMVISIVSDKDHTYFRKLLSHTDFKSAPQKYIPISMPKIPASLMCIPPQNEPRYYIKRTSGNVGYFAISFLTCGYGNPDKYVLSFIKNMLSGYFSSMMKIILREENGLTYSSYAMSSYYESFGDFTVSAITESDKLIHNGKSKKGVIPIIIDMLNNLITHGATEHIVSLTKSNIHGYMQINKGVSKNAMYNGEHVLITGTVPSPHDNIYDTYYKPITVEKVNEIMKTYFKRSAMNVTLVGGNLPSDETIKRECSKLHTA